MRIRLAMVRAWLWRCRVLPLARRTFEVVAAPGVLARRFAGGLLALDVARSDTHRLLFLEGERFVVERALLRRLAQRGETVVDVGANVGYIALLLARRVGPGGRVVCLEPVPENLVELRRNADLNRLRQVEVLPVAAGDRDGSVGMQSGLNGVIAPAAGDLVVEIRRLDSLALPRVDLVKIDVEGFEAAVVHGMSGLLEAQRPRLFLELHPDLVQAIGELRAVLAELEHRKYELCAYRPVRTGSLARRAVARYLGLGALERTRDAGIWLSEAERGGRRDPFWLVARPARERGA